MTFGQTISGNCQKEESHVPLICGLPDDLAILCLARVPRSHHHVLRCVSRKWRDLLSSEQWHFCRRKNNLVETCIYVTCITKLAAYVCYVLDPRPVERRWKVLQAIRVPRPNKYGTSVQVLGTKLYLLGGCSWQEDATREVRCYNSCTYKWEVASSMPTARCYFPSASLDDKLYVIDGHGLNSVRPTSWDVYDSNSNSWVSHPATLAHRDNDVKKIIALDGMLYTIHLSNSDRYVGLYDPASANWERTDDELAFCSCGPTIVVDGTLYMLDETFGTRLMKFDKELNKWFAIGRISTRLLSSPCHLVAIGRSIYVIGKGLSAMVIDVDRAAECSSRLLAGISIRPIFDSCHKIISCNTITI